MHSAGRSPALTMSVSGCRHRVRVMAPASACLSPSDSIVRCSSFEVVFEVVQSLSLMFRKRGHDAIRSAEDRWRQPADLSPSDRLPRGRSEQGLRSWKSSTDRPPKGTL